MVKEVKAHKMILSIASDVFRREFYGSMKESGEGIEIKNVSHEVFQTMIEFVYEKQLNWQAYDLIFLSSLYDLGEMYDIEELRKIIITSIKKYKITNDNVLNVAALAEANTLHIPLSDALYNVATVFLRRKFNGKIENVMNFCSTNEATESHALVLFKMLGRMKNMPQIPSCENCKQTPCSNGQVVTFKNNFGGRARVEAIPGKGGDKKINILSSNSSDGTFIAEFKNGSIYSCSNYFSLEFYMYKCF